MQCPVCKSENQPSARFCIFCGASLTTPETMDSDRQSQDVQDEIQRLRKLITQITNRLDSLELRLGTVAPPPPLEPAPVEEEPEYSPVETAPVETVIEEPEVEPAPVSEEIIAPSVETAPLEPLVEEPEVVPAPVPEEIITPAVEKPPRKEREWEQILGGSWLARIGVLALVIGIGFFLKYAFDNDWLGPTGRVILGVVAGLLMLGGGYRWRNRYPIMTRVLSGGGIAVLYLSIFASFALYDLVHFYAALAFLFAVSVASAIIALRYNSMSLAVLGIIGAFLAPFLLGAFEETGTGAGDGGQAVQLLAYIIVVDLGVLVLATFRNWRWFTLLALFCSLISFGVWYIEFDQQISTITAEVGITLIFVIFVGATTLFHMVWRHVTPRATDFSLMMLNAAAYFGITLGLMWNDYRGWLGLHVFLMAVLYGLISYLAYRRQAESPLFSYFAMGIAFIFLTVAIPLQLGDKAWTTIAWAAEGAVLIWLACRSKINTFRNFAYFVFVFVIVRLMAFDTVVEIAAFQPVFNERFLAFIVSIAAFGTATYFSWKNRGEEEDYEYLVFLGAANFFTMWLIAAEAYTYSQQAMSTGSSLSLIVLVLLAGAALFHRLGWQQKLLKYDLVFVLFNTLAYIIASAFLWDDLRAWMGLLYFILTFFYCILTYIVYRRDGENSLLGPVALGLAVAFLAAAFAIQLENTVWTTIAWAAEGAVLVWLAFRTRINTFRYYGYLIFAAMAVRLMAFDTVVEIATFQPVFNERFLAFIVSIAALGTATYFSWKNRGEEEDYEYLVFLGAANFFTMWLIAAEAYTYSQQAMSTGSSLSLIVLVLLAGVALFHRLAWQQKLLQYDLVFVLFNTLVYIIASTFLWDDLRAWMGLLYFILTILYGILTYMTYRRAGEVPLLRPVVMGITVALLAAAFAIQLGNTVWTTIAWAIEFFALVWLSFRYRLPQLRNYSYAVFIFMAGRLLFFDTGIDISTFQPVINERFLAYVISIAATYFAVYLLWRNRESFPEWHVPSTTIIVIINFLTIWILSFEVWQSFSRTLLDASASTGEGLRDAQHLSLTAVWAIYAVAGLVIGIWKRWRYVRLCSLGLLAVPIVKVFVYDVFQLDLGYRIGAFVGLGVLLLVSAYLYQRYGKAIKGVFTEK